MITPARISWQTDNSGLEVPVSEDFGDVYFSRDNGLAETRHVFLAGNDLDNRLTQVNNFHTFTIGELGFGTGLNILAIWQRWQQLKTTNKVKPHARLHVVTTELFPLTKADLTRALASWQELAPFSEKLIANYPPLIKGLHRLEFAEDNFSIDLWLGDAAESLAQVSSFDHANSAAIDAWFLDGFAPKCNESLWADSVLNEIQRLSGVGTTVATFSVAGVIKRGLTERGFNIKKIAGFGKKREMLTACVPANPDDEQCHQTLVNKPLVDKLDDTPKKVVVIGAGVSGLCTAYSFAKRGHQVTLVDKTAPLAGSSGNLRAMLAPKLTPTHHVHEHMHSISYLYSSRFYQGLQAQQDSSHPAIFENTQVYDLLTQSNVTAEQVGEYPADFATMLPSDTASNHANTSLPDVMALEKAGLVNPHALAQRILAHENIAFLNAEVLQLIASDTTTTVHCAESTGLAENKLMADVVVICTAERCAELTQNLATDLPQPRTTRGQISWCTVSDSQASRLPKVPLKYGGYCALLNTDAQQQFLLGASFIRGTTDLTVNHEEHDSNREKFLNAIPDCDIADLPSTDSWQGRAGLRAQMPDYLPLVGEVSAGIYSVCAMGAKGFAYAPICAELIVAQCFGGIAPLPYTLVKKLNPLRFKK